ncbi:AmpG family muropeptide MFS transporter [Flocculibacter collagenilyticus]|uniref:AmpG family muropeptide MFS transporter n=1 Tax=Flocculibacter collagenilyticus TaxID=2744479 RepID=UPI0018F4FCFE|nr:MFS transporter [Flocculibacter collagenilyticus]
MTKQHSFSQHIRCYKDKRLLSIFLFGMASGFPWVMIGSAMTAWLKEADLSRSAIGFFGVVFLTYSINFLWSPLLDRIKIPLLTKLLGLRRSWIFLTQCCIVLGCVYLSYVDVVNHLYFAGLVALGIAISSATQDIAIDAYRIDIINDDEKDKLTAGAAMATSGWWTGFGGLGSIPFFLADRPGWSWADVYLVLAGIMGLLMLTIFFSKEPNTKREQLQQNAEQAHQKMLFTEQLSTSNARRFLTWLSVTIIEPFREFFSRNGAKTALSILFFVFLFKIGEAYLGRMSVVFYKEIGFTNTDIGYFSKLLNWWVTIIFAFISSLFTIRYGIVRGLFIAGIAMSASNLLFALMAVVGPNKALFAITVLIDGFTGAWASVAFVAFISLMCNRAFTASQYALMASLGTFGRVSLGSLSGWFVDLMDGNWALFFIITAFMVIPSLVFLYSIRHKVAQLERENGNAT